MDFYFVYRGSEKQSAGLPGREDMVIVNKAAFYLVLNKAVNLNLRWMGKPTVSLCFLFFF